MADDPQGTSVRMLPLSMILGSTFEAVAEARAAGERFEDYLTAEGSKIAQEKLDLAMSHAAQGEDDEAGTSAARALDVAIKVVRRAKEIEAGVTQPRTAPQLYEWLSAHADTEVMDAVQRGVVETWWAAWRTLHPWRDPQDEDLDRQFADIHARLDALLRDPPFVAPPVSRWLRWRQVLGRI